MKKVLCAISGGIDSAVSAAILKKSGFEVFGAFIELWPKELFKEAKERARKVAKALKIPFFVFDFSKEFKQRIVDYFLKSFKKGTTPNPCVLCNKQIKFGLLLEKISSFGCEFVATGHYAKTNLYTNFKILKNVSPIKLLRAKDKNKDQSYFLWMLKQEQLRRIIFPIGNYTREEVEKLAKKFKLPVLKEKKSVEICFVKEKMNDFLKKYLKEKPGKIVDEKGKILGEHRGLWFYTIGQRKGIRLSPGPYYVLDKDLKKNLLIVTKAEKCLLKRELLAKNVNWISGKEPRLPLKVKAKIRYRAGFVLAEIKRKIKDKIYVTFKKSQRAITPGQSIVFYQGEEVVGGGIIC